MNEIIKGDIHDVIKNIPDNSIDFIYTDPPFGITGAKWDKSLRWKELFPEMWRVLKPDGVIALYSSLPFTYHLLRESNEVPKYHWKFEDSFIIPNFGCVYSRDKNYGNDLIKIAKKYNIKGLVEELSMWKYANCSLKEYIKQFQPNYVLGVSDSKLIEQKNTIQIIQRQFNNYLKTQINYKPYLEHV